MAQTSNQKFNIFAVAQSGRLQYEAVLLAASLRHSDPDFAGRLIFAEPQSSKMWNDDPRIDPQVRELLMDLGAEIVPLNNKVFGQSYPNGNKIEGLLALPKDEPFVFLDTDTLITGKISEVPFDFDRPTASMNREATWPLIELYGPGYTDTWKSLYDRFGLEFETSLDPDQPEEYWERYLYFNAGFFFFRCPHVFGRSFLKFAREIRDNPPQELVCQSLYPWLDQIALPLAVHKHGGGRDTLPDGLMDGSVTCHWRMLPLLYARESDAVVDLLEEVAKANKIKRVLKEYMPMRRMIYQGKGRDVRALFDRNNLPSKEQRIRKVIKENKLWMR